MKKIAITQFITLIICCISLSSIAQENVNKAVITTLTTISSIDEEEDISQVGSSGRRGGFGMDGDTKSITYIKDSMTKVVIKTEMMNSTIISNNSSKNTTMLMEMMGRKMGFYSSDEDLQNMSKKMLDSMPDGPRKDSMILINERDKKKTSEVITTNETKKIAGYVCNKAYIVTTNFLGQKDSSTIWYTKDLKISNLASTGGMMGFGRAVGVKNQFEDVNGFVMSYSNKVGGGRIMEVVVEKIDLKKDIDDKEFFISKEYDLKPMSEIRNMFGGMGGGTRGTIRMQ